MTVKALNLDVFKLTLKKSSLPNHLPIFANMRFVFIDFESFHNSSRKIICPNLLNKIFLDAMLVLRKWNK